MKASIRKTLLATALATGLLVSTGAYADGQDYKNTTPEWWQWALSIPVGVNPLLDTTGEQCMVGQRGNEWFLAGLAYPLSGPQERDCSIPEGVTLFFPVVNAVNFDTPNACFQGDPLPTSFYRDAAAAFIDGTSNLSASVDGKPIKQLHRVRSPVFAVALPQDNLFNHPNICNGTLPAGIYSPAVDDGYYVRLNPLKVGEHQVIIHAENTSAGFVVDVTYNLTVVPVAKK
jgi:hypothetical protein